MNYEEVLDVKNRHRDFFINNGGHSIGICSINYFINNVLSTIGICNRGDKYAILVRFREEIPVNLPSELEGVKIYYEGHCGDAVAGG